MQISAAEHILTSDENHSFCQPSLLWLCACDDAVITITCNKKNEKHQVEANSKRLLVTMAARMKVLSGRVSYRELDCAQLVKLQAFLDEAGGKEVNFCRTCSSALLPLPTRICADTRSLEYWYVNQARRSEPEHFRFASVLRGTEWYNLIRFLLMESELLPSGNIRDMCAKYGLSIAHFRRLSRYALGKTTKVGLRDWRLVRALLEFSGADKNMTTVAMDYGYSSLSHFSYEVRDTFGLSARELKQIITDG